MLADIIKRAEAGDADAQQELAHMYCHGPIYPSPPKGGWSASSGAGKSFDVPQIDTRKAAYWAGRSANQGYVPAMVTLIAAIRDGVEGEPNTGSGRTLTVPEPKTKDFMRLLVQLTKGTA